VLGNLLHVPGFEYQSSEDVLKELRGLCGPAASESLAGKGQAVGSYAGTHRVNGAPASAATHVPVVELNMYQADALVRRAPSLQKTREGRTPPAQY
jgi:NADH-quinone oxidoreductase subunit G